eukprot:1548770-Heterocapsa_arctica.AAC.1
MRLRPPSPFLGQLLASRCVHIKVRVRRRSQRMLHVGARQRQWSLLGVACFLVNADAYRIP